jgi:hypothetical protein
MPVDLCSEGMRAFNPERGRSIAATTDERVMKKPRSRWIDRGFPLIKWRGSRLRVKPRANFHTTNPLRRKWRGANAHQGRRGRKPPLLSDGLSDQLDSPIKPPQGVLCVFQTIDVLSEMGFESGRHIVEEFALLGFVKHFRFRMPFLSRGKCTWQLCNECRVVQPVVPCCALTKRPMPPSSSERPR